MYVLIGFLGLVLIISPYLLGYNLETVALLTSLIIGAVLLIASIFERVEGDKGEWWYVVSAVVGIGAVVAPFVLGFSTLTAALVTLVVVGIMTILAVGAKLFPWQTGYKDRI